MRLSVKRADSLVGELKFEIGPVYIGRQMGCQVFLPDRLISRQHAVMYIESDQWVIEDLGSANKTFLNCEAVNKCPVHNSDEITIGDFSITVLFEDENDDSIHYPTPALDETHLDIKHNIRATIRSYDTRSAPRIKMSASRHRDFIQATRRICDVKTIEELHRALLELLMNHFSAVNVWVCLNKTGSEKMDIEGGRKITSESVSEEGLVGYQEIINAKDDLKCSLIPELPVQMNSRIRSALIAPIVIYERCHGVLYAENSTDHERYTLEDIDYLMLLSVHTAAIIEKYLH